MVFKELTWNEVNDLMNRGYGYFNFMGGFAGKHKDGIIMNVGGKDYFVTDRDCKEYHQLLFEQEIEVTNYQEYLQEIGYGN